MKARSLLVAVVTLIALIAPLAHAGDGPTGASPRPAAGGADPKKPEANAGGGSGPAVRRKSSDLVVTLDRPPIVRVRCSFDNKVSGAHVEVEWDPARTVLLTQIVRLPRTTSAVVTQNLSEWSVSLWAEPTLLTASNKATFLVLKGAPATLAQVLLEQDPPAAEETCPARKEHLGRAADKSASKATVKEENDLAARACGLEASIGDGLVTERNRVPVQDLRVELRKAGPEASREGEVALFTTTPAPLGNGARSADPISGVAAELLTVIGEIAVERAKSRGLQLLSDRIRKAVCEQLVWTAELREALHVADASLDDKPLLPATCDVVQHIRIQEIGSSTKGIYTALMTDLASIGLKAIASVAGEKLLAGDSHGAMLLSLLQNPTAIASFLQNAPKTFDLGALLVDLTPSMEPAGCTPDPSKPDACKPAPLGDDKLPAVRKQIAVLAKGIADLFHLFPICTPQENCARIHKSFAALAAELKRPLHDREKSRALASEAITALKLMRGSTTFDALLSHLGGGDDQKIYLEVGKLLAASRSGFDKARTGATALEQFATKLHNQGAFAAIQEHLQDLASNLPEIAKALNLPLLVKPAEKATQERLQLVLKYVEKMGKLAVNVAEGGLPADRAAQALLAELAGERWAKHLCSDTGAEKQPECQWACGIEAGWAILGPCAQPGGTCTPASIAHDLADISNSVEGSTPDSICAKVLESYQAQVPWAKVEDILLTSLEILHPRPDATPRSLALAAIRITFDILESRLCKVGDKDTCADLTDAREILVSLVEEQPARTLVAAGKLIGRVVKRAGGAESGLGDHGKALMKITAVIAAFTSYSATYTVDTKGDEQKIKEQHEARKKAIEGLIDATTERTERGGEWVFSLGVAAGFDVVSGQLKTAADMLPVAPQLTLPMGFAIQKLPVVDPQLEFGVGCHFQLSPIDLAQFVAYDEDGTVSEPSWGSAFMIGGQIGALIGTPRDGFVLGADLRYAPTLFPKEGDVTKGAGAFRVGIFAAYYVPLFDFN